MTTRHAQSGFSLIEALVAMTVLAVTSVSILSAAQAHTRTVAALIDRTHARWVAQNSLVQLEQSGEEERLVRMAHQSWTVTLDRRATNDPDLQRVDITVSRSNSPEVALARLTGFVDVALGGIR